MESQARTRTQLRGVCCVCGKTHALKGHGLVNHGYTVDWGMFNGACSGTNNPHYGSVHAPAFLESHIAGLVEYLAGLPSEIVRAKEVVSIAQEDYRNRDDKSFQQSRAIRARLSGARNELARLKFMLDGALQESIDGYKAMLANWKESAPIEVDLDVEEAEQRKARQAAAEAKKVEQAAKAEAKKTEKAEREVKAKAKAKAAWEALATSNYYSFYYRGELLESWEQELDASKNDRQIYEILYAKRDAHWQSTGGEGVLPPHLISDYMLEVRNQPKGKGKRLFDTAIYFTPTEYLKRDWN